MSEDTLQQLRQSISDLNLEILGLLTQRGQLVLQVAELKQRRGMEPADPVREQAMLDELAASNRGPYTNDMIAAIYREVVKASRALMKP